MRKALVVIRHEIVVTLSKRSFWFMTFLFPLIILGFNLATQILASELDATVSNPFAAPDAAQPETIGYVDRASLIAQVPDLVPEGWLRAYATEDDARRDLEEGRLGSYVIIPANYVQEGRLVVVDDDFAILGAEMIENIVGVAIDSNLLGDPRLAVALASLQEDTRLIGRSVALAPTAKDDTEDTDEFADETLPYLLSFFLFFIITSSGGYVLQSVAGEKENRTVEVLLGSLRPRELMLGKVVGLGILSLFQVVVWLVAGALVLGRGTTFMGTALVLDVPRGFPIYVALYGLFGYLLVSSALAAIGALAPNVREGAQFQIIVLAPLMAPMMFGYFLAQEPNGPLATALSLFPLTAPVAMVLRLLAAPVPVWQVAVGLALLAGTAYLFVLLSARFFRADTLLSGLALDWKRLVREFRG